MREDAAPRGDTTRAGRLSDAAGLPAGSCPTCEREVLACRRLDEPAGFVCAHCDGRLPEVHWVDEAEIADLGYEAWDPLAGGCRGGCGSGGCGVRG